MNIQRVKQGARVTYANGVYMMLLGLFIILFDNMNPKNLRKAVKISKRFYETEASGGVTLSNVRKIAATGVKRISIGQITHSAPTVDFKLNFIS